MSLTIGTDITLTTGTVKRRFGDFSMQIDMPGTAKTTTMRLSSLPTIKQDFDIQSDLETVDELYVNLSEIEFSVFDKLGDGSSLFEIVNDLTLSQAIRIQVTVPNGTDYFLASKSDIKWDWRRRELTIKGNAALRYDTQITGYSTASVDFDVGEDETSGTLISHVFMKDIIRQFLETQGSSPNTVIIGHQFNYDLSNNSAGATKDPAIAIRNADANTYADAQDFLTRIAVTEGALFGVMNGYAFYVRRNYGPDSSDYSATVDGESTGATISASDLRDYGISFYNKSIRRYDFQLNFIPENGGTVAGYSDQEIIDENGVQDIDILYSFGAAGDTFGNAIYTIIHDGSRWERPTEPSLTKGISDAEWDAIGENSKDSYKKALGINQPFKVSFEIFGINTLKPFQFIDFDSDIAEPLTNTHLRPSSLEYNLEEDVIIGEGYFI